MVIRGSASTRGRGGGRAIAVAALAVALGALAGAAPAGAFNTDFDPDTIPRLPCGSPGATRDVWCGDWITDPPTGTTWTFASLGLLRLQRIAEADARARDGTQFGDFAYTVKCFPGALFYAGTYNGQDGRVMACTNGSVLKGFYRSQAPENTGPGASLRSGEFEITHNLGGAGSSRFSGTISQHFAGTTGWTGTCPGPTTCEAGSLDAPGVPPGAAPGQPPIAGPPRYRVVGAGSDATHRSGVDGTVRGLQIGWVLGARDIVTVPVVQRILTSAPITLEKLPGGERIEIGYGRFLAKDGDSVRTPAIFEVQERPVLRQGTATVTTAGRALQAVEAQASGVELLTPVSRIVAGGGVATVAHDARRGVTTVGNTRGSVLVTVAAGGRTVRLAPGREVDVSRRGVTTPSPLVPDLRTAIPRPQEVRAGPVVVTAPSRVTLRSLRRSRCVAVTVSTARPARGLVTLFSGRARPRLFGQRLVVFAGPGRARACIGVPRHARSFPLETRLRLAVGTRIAGRPRPPVIRPVGLMP
jgi:hypothetical protein